MKKDVNKIASEIKELLDQLVTMVSSQKKGKKITKTVKVMTTPKGASGALSMLTQEGFFDTPKDISLVMERLKEIGRYYPRTTVSMNLLNLTKRRIFNRFENKETKNWEYVIRK